MNRGRINILHLLACGRLTAAEAERLLAMWNEGHELAWLAVLCLGMAALGAMERWIPAAAHSAGAQALLHRAAWAIQHWIGGRGV